jgi:hypothetical protein
MGQIDVSECLARQVQPGETIKPVSPYFSLSFDAQGRLVSFDQAVKEETQDLHG